MVIFHSKMLVYQRVHISILVLVGKSSIWGLSKLPSLMTPSGIFVSCRLQDTVQAKNDGENLAYQARDGIVGMGWSTPRTFQNTRSILDGHFNPLVSQLRKYLFCRVSKIGTGGPKIGWLSPRNPNLGCERKGSSKQPGERLVETDGVVISITKWPCLGFWVIWFFNS
jgi:hypothetical protein